ncbi:hypothetical protein Leryth_025074 [Lithospermum erythrorhizon]|nr:hypothetical protein Leryth_025074 [Lithospermum erythrorhizon]
MVNDADESYLTNGYLNTKIDWIPAMKGIRLKDLPTFLRTTDENDTMFNYNLEQVNNALKTRTLILNTFRATSLDAIQTDSRLCTIGPLAILDEEEIDKKDTRSVLYVNFGSLVIMTTMRLSEFAWGLANSKYSFLWAIRPNLVNGCEEILSNEFLEEIDDQQINCHYACKRWGIGMEIVENVDRKDVERLVRELMDGQKGKEMRQKVMELQMLAKRATKLGGSSYDSFHHWKMNFQSRGKPRRIWPLISL